MQYRLKALPASRSAQLVSFSPFSLRCLLVLPVLPLRFCPCFFFFWSLSFAPRSPSSLCSFLFALLARLFAFLSLSLSLLPLPRFFLPPLCCCCLCVSSLCVSPPPSVLRFGPAHTFLVASPSSFFSPFSRCFFRVRTFFALVGLLFFSPVAPASGPLPGSPPLCVVLRRRSGILSRRADHDRGRMGDCFSLSQALPIETSFRYEKSELALESPRIWALKIASNFLGSSRWSILFYFICSIQSTEISFNLFCTSSVINRK